MLSGTTWDTVLLYHIFPPHANNFKSYCTFFTLFIDFVPHKAFMYVYDIIRESSHMHDDVTKHTVHACHAGVIMTSYDVM